MTKLQKELDTEGHNMMIGVFAQLGGGFAETGMFRIRTITETAAETGKIIDEYFRVQLGLMLGMMLNNT